MSALRTATIRLAFEQPKGSKLRRELLAALKESYESGDRESDGWNPGATTSRTPWPEGTGSLMPPARNMKGDPVDNTDFVDNHFAKSADLNSGLRSRAIRLAHSLPKGSDERKAILAALAKESRFGSGKILDGEVKALVKVNVAYQIHHGKATYDKRKGYRNSNGLKIVEVTAPATLTLLGKKTPFEVTYRTVLFPANQFRDEELNHHRSVQWVSTTLPTPLERVFENALANSGAEESRGRLLFH